MDIDLDHEKAMAQSAISSLFSEVNASLDLETCRSSAMALLA